MAPKPFGAFGHQTYHHVRGYSTSLGSDLRLSYYHYDKYNRTVLPFVTEHADIVVLNVGVHYLKFTDYEHDVSNLFEDLQPICRPAGEKTADEERNDLSEGDDARKKKKPRCLFMETPPQHFISPNLPQERQVGTFTRYDANATRKSNIYKCGPIRSDKTPYNAVVANVSRRFPVTKIPTVIPSAQRLAPLWNYHKPGDCTHYCQDATVWDNVHDAFVTALLSLS